MEPLKEMFNLAFFEEFAKTIHTIDSTFEKKEFVKEVTNELQDLSLNQRMRQTSVVLKNYLPSDYKKTLTLLKKVIPHTKGGYTNLVFPDFVGLYGQNHPELSLDALKYFTQFGSSEFAIREFLKRDFDSTLKVMKVWATDNNEHVRRLASEGSRPRLPWSFKLDRVIENPKLTTPILELLKEDESLYVRKSVANHLNDVSKEHADYMIKLVSGWNQAHPHTAWIVKHASRTLIKKGHPDSLQVFKFEKNIQVAVENFKLKKSKIKLGEKLEFSFDLLSKKNKSQKLVVDYILHYRKKGGELSPKVFKLKELDLRPNETIHIQKSQLIKDFSTRKHFAGEHVLEIQVNGKVLGKTSFKLII